jgi:hypothetical protein
MLMNFAIVSRLYVCRRRPVDKFLLNGSQNGVFVGDFRTFLAYAGNTSPKCPFFFSCRVFSSCGVAVTSLQQVVVFGLTTAVLGLPLG